MRKIIYVINISIDGCVDHTGFKADEELFDYFTTNMRDIDLGVYGRKMYRVMFPYWADVAKNQSGTKWKNEFAQSIADVDKVVFSRSLDNIYERSFTSQTFNGVHHGSFDGLKAYGQKGYKDCHDSR
jgi:hypothetical protein